MTLAICPLDQKLAFDFAFFEEHPTPIEYVLLIDAITPVRGLFYNAVLKVFGRFAEIHIQTPDNLKIEDGQIIIEDTSSPSVYSEALGGLEKLKAAGVTEVVFLFSGEVTSEQLELVKFLEGRGIGIRVENWGEVISI